MPDLEKRIEALSPQKQALLRARLKGITAPEPGGEPQRGSTRLVAYAVPTSEGYMPSSADLRQFLPDRVPAYMVPSAFVVLDDLPRTPNGKIDRGALPDPQEAGFGLEVAFVPPRNPTEEKLAEIWAEVLGFDLISVHDNFFEVGGDSILSIQIVSRAKAAGLHLAPAQLFQHPTIAELAAVAEVADEPQAATQAPITGPVPLTPIQHWFFEQAFADPHHWNQAVVLETPPGTQEGHLAQALRHLVHHHDALRLRLTRTAEGWAQVNAGGEASVALAHHDLAGVPEPERAAAMEQAATEVQAGFDLATGPLLGAAFFTEGEARPGHLLLAIHHLAVDNISWRILLEDLGTVYGQIRAGTAPSLPPKTTSFKGWAEKLTAYVQSAALRAEEAYWRERPAEAVAAIPVDFPAGGANAEASARTLTVSLDTEETETLLKDVPPVYNTQINDVLLTALLQAFAPWTGHAGLALGMEGHGREPISDGLDLTRSVGWFTSFYPVALTLAGVSGPGEALKSVKEQLRRVPGRGIGFGLLRYLSAEGRVRDALAALPRPEVLFNYLGQVDQGRTASVFRPVEGVTGAMRSPRNRRHHVLEINARVAAGQLHIEWIYSRHRHEADTIASVAERFLAKLRALMAHCADPDAGGFTPSDFPEAGLSQDALDRFLDQIS